MSNAPLAVPGEDPVDPITFEVIRHKLRAITEEQAVTIRSVSGSSIVTDVADFNTGIYGPHGEVICMGWHVGFKSGCLSGMIRHIDESFKDKLGINDGDMFVVNDPYVGALHQNDVAVLAPIIYDGKCVAWTGADCHEIDIGGMTFGGFHANVTDVQQEGLLLPGVKLVELGRVREDIWNTIMGMVRLPAMVALDLKAMIAANTVAIRRLVEMMDRYGAETVSTVMCMEIRSSERQFRARLKLLPDGMFRAADFLEHDGHENSLFKVAVALEKRGDRLRIDMAGTSPQASGSINCAKNGLRGAVLAGILPILAPDMRWNEGIFSTVEISAPEGCLVNATRPAPVSGATIGAMFMTCQAIQAAASRLAACLADTCKYASAPAKGNVLGNTWNGLNRDGSPCGGAYGDVMAGGGGAYFDHDGLDPGADFCIPQPVIGNVERYESSAPYLLLYRSLMPDSGGAGRCRGGLGIEYAITPHETAVLSARIISSGMGVPELGIMGGMAAGCNIVFFVDRKQAAGSPVGRITGLHSVGSAGGEVHSLEPKTRAFPVRAGDVVAFCSQGGAGYGDPLDREPNRVRADVLNGLVSGEMAARCYGVILTGEAVDEEASKQRRADIRHTRLRGDTPTRVATAGLQHPLGALRLDQNGDFVCRCGQVLGKSHEDWKQRAVTRAIDPAEHGPAVIVREELEIREHVCPSCATLLEAELLRKRDPDLQTIEMY